MTPQAHAPLLPCWSDIPAVLVGVVHLRPLPGSPRYGGDAETVRRAALADADALARGGADGILVENFGDAPFWPHRVPAVVVAHMAVLAQEIRAASGLPTGVNVLRNDGEGALAVAHASGAAFVRVNVLCGAVVADQGIVTGIAHRLMRRRAELRATTAVWADVRVKHATPLAARPIADEVRDTIDRGLADAVVVTGPSTGRAVEPDMLAAAVAAAGVTPVVVGSGATPENVRELVPRAAGLIVGTALKRDGNVAAPVDPDRVRRMVDAVRQA